MQITLSLLLLYPSNTIRRPHSTLPTSCILVALFPPKEVRIKSKQQCMKTLRPGMELRYKNTPANQPYPGCTVSLR